MGAVSINYQSPPYGIFQNLGHRYWTGPMTVTMSSSYATGGDTITLAQVGFGSQIDAMIVASMNTHVSSSDTTFYVFVLNSVNAPTYTIQAFTASGSPASTAALVESAANATALNGYSFSAIFVGV